MTIYDLSLTLDASLPAFEGDPRYSLTSAIAIEAAGYSVAELRMGTHGGTHIDVERHVISDGRDTETTPLDVFIGGALVIPAIVGGGFAALPDAAFGALGRGDIALIHTGWDEHFGRDDYLEGYPAFREEDMRRLIGLGVKAVGADLPSFETDLSCRIHRILLGAGVGLIESLAGLEPLINKRCLFCAAPLKLRGGDGSPVRAFAMV